MYRLATRCDMLIVASHLTFIICFGVSPPTRTKKAKHLSLQPMLNERAPKKWQLEFM